MEPATRMHRAECGPLCAEAPSSSCRPFASAHVALLSATDAPALRRRRRVPTDASAPPHPGKVHATATAHTPMDTGWPSSRGSGDAAGIRSRGRRPCARHRPPHRAGGSGGGKCRRQGTGGRALRAGRRAHGPAGRFPTLSSHRAEAGFALPPHARTHTRGAPVVIDGGHRQTLFARHVCVSFLCSAAPAGCPSTSLFPLTHRPHSRSRSHSDNLFSTRPPTVTVHDLQPL